MFVGYAVFLPKISHRACNGVPVRPGPDTDIVVVVGIGIEARQPGRRVGDLGVGVVDDQPVEEGAAVGLNREPESVRPEQPQQRLCHEAALQGQTASVARSLLVHRVEQIAVPAFGHGLRGPECGVRPDGNGSGIRRCNKARQYGDFHGRGCRARLGRRGRPTAFSAQMVPRMPF